MAQRSVKPIGNKWPSTNRIGRCGRHAEGNSKQLSPSWMRNIKGFFVRRQNHPTRHRHNKEEITASIETLNTRIAIALLTVKNLSEIYAMMKIGDDADKEEPSDLVQRIQDSLADEDNISLPASEEGTKIAQSFTQNAFLHGRSIGAKI